MQGMAGDAHAAVAWPSARVSGSAVLMLGPCMHFGAVCPGIAPTAPIEGYTQKHESQPGVSANTLRVHDECPSWSVDPLPCVILRVLGPSKHNPVQVPGVVLPANGPLQAAVVYAGFEMVLPANHAFQAAGVYAGSDVVLVAKEAAMRPLRRLMAQLDCLDDEPHGNPQQAQAAQADVQRSVASKVSRAGPGCQCAGLPVVRAHGAQRAISAGHQGYCAGATQAAVEGQSALAVQQGVRRVQERVLCICCVYSVAPKQARCCTQEASCGASAAALPSCLAISALCSGSFPLTLHDIGLLSLPLQLEPISIADVEAALSVTKPSARLLEQKYKQFNDEFGQTGT